MPKQPQIVKCPSCQEDVTLGKFCLSCGAELVTERSARLGEDVLEQIAERAADKMIERLEKRERDKIPAAGAPPPAADPTAGASPPAPAAEESPKQKGGRFWKGI